MGLQLSAQATCLGGSGWLDTPPAAGWTGDTSQHDPLLSKRCLISNFDGFGPQPFDSSGKLQFNLSFLSCQCYNEYLAIEEEVLNGPLVSM